MQVIEDSCDPLRNFSSIDDSFTLQLFERLQCAIAFQVSGYSREHHLLVGFRGKPDDKTRGILGSHKCPGGIKEGRDSRCRGDGAVVAGVVTAGPAEDAPFDYVTGSGVSEAMRWLQST